MRSIRKYQTERTISITKPNVTFIGIFKKGNKLKKKLTNRDDWVEVATEEWFGETKINGNNKQIQMRRAGQKCCGVGLEIDVRLGTFQNVNQD